MSQPRPARVDLDEGNSIRYAREGDLDAVKNCLADFTENIDIQTKIGDQIALMSEASKDHTEVVEVLLNQDPPLDVDRVDALGTGLPLVARIGRLDLAEELEGKYGATPSDEAVRAQKSEVVEIHLKARSTSGLDSINHRVPALVAAVSGDDEDKVKFLLDEGADPFEVDEDGDSAFGLALAKGDVELEKLLETRPDLDINMAGDGKQTALHLAALANLTAPKFLSRPELKVDVVTSAGKTPLILAAQNGRLEFIEALFRRPEPPQLEIKGGPFQDTALAAAVANNHQEVVEFLVKKGADVYTRDSDGDSIFYWAIRNRELTRMLIETKAEANSELTPRPRAIALAIQEATRPHYDAAGDAADDILKALIRKEYANAVDNRGRTPLSWAAEEGHLAVFVALIESHSGARVDQTDAADLSPLYYAATNGHVKVVKALLNVGASRSVQNGKPLSQLMDEKEKESNMELKAAEAEVSAAEKKLKEARKARDDLASSKGVEGERQHGVQSQQGQPGTVNADDDAKVKADEKVVEAQRAVADAEKKRAKIEKKAIVQQEVRDFLGTKSLFLAASNFRGGIVEEKFRATVMWCRDKDERFCSRRSVSVLDLLFGAVPDKPAHICKWLHLPANNMRWVEALMFKHYQSCEEENRQSWKAELVLRPDLWLDQQHRPAKTDNHHARFMHPGCYELPLRPREVKETQEKLDPGKSRRDGAVPSLTGDQKRKPEKPKAKSEPASAWPQRCIGLVAFMPYLHWERIEDFDKLKDAIEKSKQGIKKSKQDGKPEGADDAKGDKTGEQAPDEHYEQLLVTYLKEAHRPVHCRRTLDQYYYHTLPDTSRRDKDQTPMWHLKHQEDQVMTVVDQLWMWVLPPCGKSPATVITAFPQRSFRQDPWKPTALVRNICKAFSDLEEKSCYTLAEVIVGECSKIYHLETKSSRLKSLQFLEIYASAIAEILDQDAERFSDFQQSLAATSTRGSESFSIEEDIRDLGHVKDIRDELNIMIELLHAQIGVAEEIDRLLRNGEAHSRKEGSEENARRFAPIAAINKHLDHIRRLDRFAERAASAIEQLLDLKHKQSLMDIYEETEKQGGTIMYFTVATIVFLPLSFMTGFLAINVAEFPKTEDGLELAYVLKVILSVSVGFIVPSLFVAFNINTLKNWREHGRHIIERAERWLAPPAKEASARVVGAATGAALWAAPDVVVREAPWVVGNIREPRVRRGPWRALRWWHARRRVREGSGSSNEERGPVEVSPDSK